MERMTGKKLTHIERVHSMMEDIPRIRNASLIGHVDHGKTTLSDSLLASSGLLNPQLAGTALLLDFLDEEQERGITMKAANISLVFEPDGKEMLVNLVDTPGHVDFSGKVTRALRLIDAAIVVVDAAEGVMIQTEHVVRQALENAVRPLLFINKIDRLIKELDLDNRQIQDRFKKIIDEFNHLIAHGPHSHDGLDTREWSVDLESGTVAFGSALHGWGTTLELFLANFPSFSAIIDVYNNQDGMKGGISSLKEKLPVQDAIVSMLWKNAPDPAQAQAYRIPAIWNGPIKSDLGQALCGCDPTGPAMVFVSKVQIDHGFTVATGRVFSGKIHAGDDVYLIRSGEKVTVPSIGVFMGHRVIEVDSVSAGNVVAIKGLKGIRSGETLLSTAYAGDAGGNLAFEQMSYLMEPVITVCIEPEKLGDMKKLHAILEGKLIEDPNLRIEESDQTGEILLSGIGPLHLEVITNEIKKAGIPVYVSDPLTLYHESIGSAVGPLTGSSTNGKNEISMRLEPIDPADALILKANVALGDNGLVTKRSISLLGETGITWSREEVGRLIYSSMGNAVVLAKNLIAPSQDGVQAKDTPKHSIDELLVLVRSLESILKHGPLVGEPLGNVKLIIEKLTLAPGTGDKDASEVIPMIRQVLFDLMERSGTVLLEPVFESTVYGAIENLGKITSLISQHGGRIELVTQEGLSLKIRALFPVRTSFHLIEDARTSTSGRAVFQNVFAGHEPVPSSVAKTIIGDLKAKKGLI